MSIVPVAYDEFIERKTQIGGEHGFAPIWMPQFLFPFQKSLVEWALKKGRAAVFADCGLGKTLIQLVWAENVSRHTNGRVLVLTPLAVGAQTVREAAKFMMTAVQSRDGSLTDGPGIIVTNYEKLHLFKSSDFAGVVCDESSILKHFRGATQTNVTRFLTKVPYRLLCTATAAPNDYVELGTSSEALGELGHMEMLGRFFSQREIPHRLNEMKARLAGQPKEMGGESEHGDKWHLKKHAETAFWRWVVSWARACRMPSDLGFANGAFLLPELIEDWHIVKARSLPDGYLFPRVADGLQEEREERRRTLPERCEYVASLATAHDKPVAIWCHLNAEGDLLEKLIPNSVQVSGSDTDKAKERAFTDFATGRVTRLITKPKIGAWGLNWQHCAHVITFASHSYEQYYQSVRRCWRFGQTQPVRVDIVSTEGEAAVRDNMRRKGAAASEMFIALVAHMAQAYRIERTRHSQHIEVPAWL